ncbi:MAG TPA: transcription termination/antitermination protein NusA [Dehalococcoidia bacterium]|nr:transcription termination/antitermination protein NusA [Dehalococcoidia bacterium]
MKSDFMLAITQLSAEKNLPRETVLEAVEAALVSAYKKNNFAPNQDILVRINPNTGGIKVWVQKTVVELPTDQRREITLDEALQLKADAQLGDTVEIEATPHNAGRIAAQTAKQVILQRLHEAEHSAIFEEFADKEGNIVTGMVRRIEPRQLFIDLGRTEAILPAAEQVHNERYRVGQRLKVCLLEVIQTNRGPRVLVSRSHPNLLRRLFELEVPEVLNGTVEIKSVAREAGYRSKVAVVARQEGIDPVGCCVGLRGIRIQNIVNELSGEKIDVIMWSPDRSVFITNALSPAHVVNVTVNEKEETATVVVPDNQLSLAIGKEGQNVRLAAKLISLRIDIKSASEAAAEAEALASVAEAEAVAEEELPGEAPVVEEPVLASSEAVETAEEIEEAPAPQAAAESEAPTPVSPEAQPSEEKAEIRFAEDIVVPTPVKLGAKPKKKKKKSAPGKVAAEDGIKIKKRRRVSQSPEDYEEDELLASTFRNEPVSPAARQDQSES